MSESAPVLPDSRTARLQNHPVLQFQSWLKEAREAESGDPTAMTLSTVDNSGRPSGRMVLLKEADERGFVFYTNTESRKGQELDGNPWASLVFYWSSLRRQVRIEGRVETVSEEEADAYFASRPRGSQIGAWASDQSRPLEDPFELEKNVARFAVKFGTGAVPRPPHWTGFRVIPDRIEFWRSKPFRLHERIVHEWDEDGGWSVFQLFP